MHQAAVAVIDNRHAAFKVAQSPLESMEIARLSMFPLLLSVLFKRPSILASLLQWLVDAEVSLRARAYADVLTTPGITEKLPSPCCAAQDGVAIVSRRAKENHWVVEERETSSCSFQQLHTLQM